MFHISIWGGWSFFGGLSPPKPPRGDGTGLTPNFRLATPLLVIIFIQTACISLAPSHVSQYLTFDTGRPYLMFNLTLTKSSQQSKTARHCRTPLKSSIVIFVLCSKQYYRAVTVPTHKSLYVCIFACFEVNCEGIPLRSFADFTLMCRHKKGRSGTLGAWSIWRMRKSVNGYCALLGIGNRRISPSLYETVA